MTYSLTLRLPLGRRLTNREMDNNFLYLQDLAGGGGGTSSSYIDNIVGRIVELGSITYTDINTSDATMSIDFSLMDISRDEYIYEIYANTIEGFESSTALIDDQGTSIIGDYIDTGSLDSFFNSDSDTKVVYRLSSTRTVQVSNDDLNVKISLSFLNINDGVTNISNPKDFTKGSIVIKALVKKFI